MATLVSGEAVYKTAAGGSVNIVVPVNFVLNVGEGVVLVAVSTNVLVVVLVEEGNAWADT